MIQAELETRVHHICDFHFRYTRLTGLPVIDVRLISLSSKFNHCTVSNSGDILLHFVGHRKLVENVGKHSFFLLLLNPYQLLTLKGLVLGSLALRIQLKGPYNVIFSRFSVIESQLGCGCLIIILYCLVVNPPGLHPLGLLQAINGKVEAAGL